MPGKPEQPDWLDELYQADNTELPPESVDAAIKAAARTALQPLPWYRRGRALASVATLVIGLGIVSLWINTPEEAVHVTMESEPTLRRAPVETVAEVETADTVAPTGSNQFADQPAPTAPAPAAVAAEAQADALTDHTVDASSAADVSNKALPAAGATAPGQPVRAERRAQLSNISFAEELAESVSGADCAQTTLIDAGSRTPYAVCSNDDRTLVHHADCPTPHDVEDGTISTSEQPGTLLVETADQRLHLWCDADSGTWISEGLRKPQLRKPQLQEPN